MLRKLALGLIATCMIATPLRSQPRTDSITVPLIVEKNRPFVMIEFRRPDGSTRRARFLVDTGGGGFLITEPLARDLGLEWGTPSKEGSSEFAQVRRPPASFVGGLELRLEPSRVLAMLGTGNILRDTVAGHAEGMLPGHVLARYHVVFDYPAGTFTLARPGVLTPRGDVSPMPVQRQVGFPRTEIIVDGVKHGMLLDTGASFTMVSEVLLKAWGASHSDWPRHTGAHGEAVVHGGQTLETMFLPGGSWQSQAIPAFGVVSQREGTFEKYMSGMMTAPIVGALAGNVLKHFRVELDYANERLYLSR